MSNMILADVKCQTRIYKMNKWIIPLLSLFVVFSISIRSFAEVGTGMPVKYIASCEMDFNKDNVPDIALLFETSRERELVVLVNETSGYKAYIVSRGKPNMYLSCQFGNSIKETSSGEGNGGGKVYETPGTYIQLTQPEGSSVVYFWDKNSFKEVWVSD